MAAKNGHTAAVGPSTLEPAISFMFVASQGPRATCLLKPVEATARGPAALWSATFPKLALGDHSNRFPFQFPVIICPSFFLAGARVLWRLIDSWRPHSNRGCGLSVLPVQIKGIEWVWFANRKQFLPLD